MQRSSSSSKPSGGGSDHQHQQPSPSRRGTDAPAADLPSENDPAQPWMNGSVLDRRLGLDRREIAARLGRDGAERGEPGTGLDRRRGPGRRRTDFTKSAEEGEMTGEQFLFVMAIDAFKKANAKMFPTWTDVLEVVRLLGYRKTMASELNLKNVEDWREASDTPSGVRAKPGHPEHGQQRDAA